MLYLLKSSAVLFVLILFYKVFLEKEKAFVFNRVYLLSALAISLISPFITYAVSIEWAEFILPEQTLAYGYNDVFTEKNLGTNISSLKINWSIALFVLYSLGFIGMFIKFNKNLYNLINRCKKAKFEKINSYKIVTEGKNSIPFSFFHYIFLPKYAAPEILEHEKRHADAYHSIDVLISELLLIVFWFNPLFYWHKRLITQNHEYYADAYSKNRDLKKYKLLIFNQIYKNKANTLASGFDYSIIKKRMMMLQKSRSGPLLWAKKLMVLPLFALLSFIACEKTYAQVNKDSKSTITAKSTSNLIVEVDGKTNSNVQFYYNNMDQPISPANMHTLLKKISLMDMDQLSFRVNGKMLEGKSLPEIIYTEEKKELFMRKLKAPQGLLKIKTEAHANGKKYRGIKLDDGNNMSTWYTGESIPPPPPPPMAPMAPKAATKAEKSTLPPPPPPPKAPETAKAPPPPPSAPTAVNAPSELPPPPPPPRAPETLDELNKLIKHVESELANHKSGAHKLTEKEVKWNKQLLQKLYNKKKDFK